MLVLLLILAYILSVVLTYGVLAGSTRGFLGFYEKTDFWICFGLSLVPGLNLASVLFFAVLAWHGVYYGKPEDWNAN